MEEDPPSYQESSQQANVFQPGLQEGVFSPTTFYVAGRFIHSADPGAPPLYELSHSVGFLKDSDRNVRIERLEYSIKRRDGVAQLAARKRHIYDLKHPTGVTGPTFAYHAEPTSRQSPYAFGLETFRPRRLSSAKGYRILRATHALDRRLVRRDVLFSALPVKDNSVRFEWSDAEGQLIAREVDVDGLMTLVVSAMMGAVQRDVLISAWMSRVWAELAKRQ
ncbi:hypothetical protein MKX07_005727 [Trichoderma sp. CBMAI-0711]|jgi:hypothetical protein|uniref:Uncharacterized protein n=3 Tax=Trichoderma TaxID=5543 RepID=A0A2H2ZXY1_TRIPA|nr:hypothetical protein M419DRAFT_68451 [Trichoderma reesei RUT C-30]KAK1251172.1 hypothetical protein MKX07_005727 [Trichoderma sp. CBMAI-0711]OTA04034.1 hypothetical protein A9Z42_0045920 [Trichoderma parareesei]